MRKLMLAAALAVAPALAAAQQPPCAPLPVVAQMLEREFNERMVTAARLSNGGTMHVFASQGGAWTLVVVSPAGSACIIADGSAWSILEPTGRKS